MAVKWIQDPEAILDYTLDWSDRLVEGDTIAHVQFIPDAGLSVLSENVTDSTKYPDRPGQAVTVWLLGGVVGQTYNVVCHITTAGGRQDDRTFQIVIKEK